jgi:hypothetical protein
MILWHILFCGKVEYGVNLFFLDSGQVGSTIFVVAISIDRFLTVCHTSFAKRHWKKPRLVCACVSILVVLLSLAFAIRPWVSYYVVPAENGDGFILKRNEFGKSSLVVTYKLWVYAIFIMILPFPVLATLNALIYRKVRKA